MFGNICKDIPQEQLKKINLDEFCCDDCLNFIKCYRHDMCQALYSCKKCDCYSEGCSCKGNKHNKKELK